MKPNIKFHLGTYLKKGIFSLSFSKAMNGKTNILPPAQPAVNWLFQPKTPRQQFQENLNWYFWTVVKSDMNTTFFVLVSVKSYSRS